MNDDQNRHTSDPSGSDQPCATRDVRGRRMKGNCPDPKGRPKKKRFKDFKPIDAWHFVSTQIEVATADGLQMMDRRTSFLNMSCQGAMKGKATPLQMPMGLIEENGQQKSGLRPQYEHLVRPFILDNPGVKSIDMSLTARQSVALLGLASTLNYSYTVQ